MALWSILFFLIIIQIIQICLGIASEHSPTCWVTLLVLESCTTWADTSLQTWPPPTWLAIGKVLLLSNLKVLWVAEPIRRRASQATVDWVPAPETGTILTSPRLPSKLNGNRRLCESRPRRRWSRRLKVPRRDPKSPRAPIYSSYKISTTTKEKEKCVTIKTT